MANFEKFKESISRFENHPIRNDLIGFCNWQIIDENRIIESWNHKEYGPIIIQFYPNGKGFETYKAF